MSDFCGYQLVLDLYSCDIEKLRDEIGVEWEPRAYEIEKGMIRRFARAIDDQNPLWQDEEYASKSQCGGIIAPPTFILTIGFEQVQQKMTDLMPDAGRLHGGTELECYLPVRPGDTITASGKIANVRERIGKSTGKMLFVTFDISYTNQRQESVAKCRQLTILYRPGGAKHA